MDRDTIEEIIYWRFETSTVVGSDEVTEEEMKMKWTMHDQARWFRMCMVLTEMVLRIFPSLQSSTPSSLAAEDENYWIRRLYEEDITENDQGDIDNSIVDDDNDEDDDAPVLCIGDKNGFYKLRIPLLMNPDARKTICLLTMREVEWYDTDEKILLKDSATHFLRFVNRFSAFAGHLFPGRFVVLAATYALNKNEEFRSASEYYVVRRDLTDLPGRTYL